MRVYRVLLHLYPAAFRAEYGDSMYEIFARRRLDTTGPVSVAGLWVATFFEILFNALAVHLDILRQDIRYTTRTLARTPGFALTAIIVVALGIGANTAAFSVADFVLIRPLSFPEPDRLVKLWESYRVYSRTELSPASYRDWKRMTASFEGMGVFALIPVNVVGPGDPERVDAAAITADLFPLLGVRPVLGRLFTAAEDRAGAPGTLLMSYGMWQGRFGGDPSVLGRSVILDNAPFTVIGVMPREFRFPNRDTQLWRPIQFREEDFQDRGNNYLTGVARLKRGVTLAQARAELAVVTAQLEHMYPKNEQPGATAILLKDELSKQSRLMLIALSGAALCVLLITCANLTSLLLARAMTRQRELAVRSALGAGRERLLRQMLTESLVLAIVGGMLGVLAAVATVPVLARLVPNSLPIAQTPSIDFRMLCFAGLLTLITGIFFGAVPALRVSSKVELSGLREGSRSGGGRKERLRSALVITEVMASVVLLVAAGLLIRALWRLQATDPGFRAENVLTLRTALSFPKYAATAKRREFYSRVLTGIRQLPGVSSAGYISGLPMVMRGGIWGVTIDGKARERFSASNASVRFVTPGFFAALGIPLFLGRDVSESDTVDRPFAAVVSESFVRRYWPDQNPLGRHFETARHDWTVVGVVGDIRVRGFEQSSEPQAYLPYQQVADGWFPFYAPKDLVIRSSAAPGALLPAVRRIIRAADREQPISAVQTMDEILAGETAARGTQVRVLGAFAAIAVVLAGIGIHGLLAFAVSQRAQEIGVRIALGARSGDILRMVLRQGVLVAAAGVIPGIALAYAAGRAMQALLAGVKPGDAVTFLTAAGLCVLMTLMGSLLPAVRAVRLDPIAAIRSE